MKFYKHSSFLGSLVFLVIIGCNSFFTTNDKIEKQQDNIVSRRVSQPIDSFKVEYLPSGFRNLSHFSLLNDVEFGDVLVAYNVDLLDSINDLLFFDIDKGNLLQTLNLYRYTSYKVKDFYVHSLDSIFIHIVENNEIRLISLKEEHLNNRIWKYEPNQYKIWSLLLNRLDFNKGAFVGRMSENNFKSTPGSPELFDEVFNQKSVFGYLNDTIGELAFGSYPFTYKEIKNKVLLAMISLPRAVFAGENIAVNYMLSDYLYIFNRDSLVLIDSILINESAFDLNDIIKFIDNEEQVNKDTVLFHAYRTGVFFDICTTPCRRYVLRSAFANGFKRYIYKINISTKAIEVFEIESSPSYSMLPLLPSNDGFYLLKYISNEEDTPMLYFFDY